MNKNKVKYSKRGDMLVNFIDAYEKKGTMDRVFWTIHNTILESFRSEVKKNLIVTPEQVKRSHIMPDTVVDSGTEAEIGRRFDILANWYMIMRKDQRLSVPETLDNLPLALEAELDGNRNWEPPPRKEGLRAGGETLKEVANRRR